MTTIPDHVDVAVVGGGIGGLATAVALRHLGVDVHVVERTPVLREAGGALVVRESAVEHVRRWGLAEELLRGAVPVDVIEHRDAAGVAFRTSGADLTGEGQAYSTLRADVHSALLNALPADRVHLGVTTVEAGNEGDRAVARFADGTQLAARLLVGADGIRSVVRRAVVRDELIFARLVVLRGMAPAAALPAGMRNDRLTVWEEGGRTLLTLPLRGGSLVAMDTALTRDEPPAGLWNNEVPTQELLDHFAGFDPRLLDMIKAGTVPVLANPVFERDPVPTWSNGRITLVGDAAHAMAPRQGQGANQAIRDAAALADAVHRHGLADVAAALARYESVRIEAAAQMQLLSRSDPDFDAAAL